MSMARVLPHLQEVCHLLALWDDKAKAVEEGWDLRTQQAGTAGAFSEAAAAFSM